MLCPKCDGVEMDVEYIEPQSPKSKGDIIKKLECPSCHVRVWRRMELADAALGEQQNVAALSVALGVATEVPDHLICEVCQGKTNALYILPEGLGCTDCRARSAETEAVNQHYRALMAE